MRKHGGVVVLASGVLMIGAAPAAACSPQDYMSPEQWQALSPGQREEILADGQHIDELHGLPESPSAGGADPAVEPAAPPADASSPAPAAPAVTQAEPPAPDRQSPVVVDRGARDRSGAARGQGRREASRRDERVPGRPRRVDAPAARPAPTSPEPVATAPRVSAASGSPAGNRATTDARSAATSPRVRSVAGRFPRAGSRNRRTTSRGEVAPRATADETSRPSAVASVAVAPPRPEPATSAVSAEPESVPALGALMAALAGAVTAGLLVLRRRGGFGGSAAATVAPPPPSDPVEAELQALLAQREQPGGPTQGAMPPVSAVGAGAAEEPADAATSA